MRRQHRKLNFLITQTELYAHFMARKMNTTTSEATGETSAVDDTSAILERLNEKHTLVATQSSSNLVDLEADTFGTELLFILQEKKE